MVHLKDSHISLVLQLACPALGIVKGCKVEVKSNTGQGESHLVRKLAAFCQEIKRWDSKAVTVYDHLTDKDFRDLQESIRDEFNNAMKNAEKQLQEVHKIREQVRQLKDLEDRHVEFAKFAPPGVGDEEDDIRELTRKVLGDDPRDTVHTRRSTVFAGGEKGADKEGKGNGKGKAEDRKRKFPKIRESVQAGLAAASDQSHATSSTSLARITTAEKSTKSVKLTKKGKEPESSKDSDAQELASTEPSNESHVTDESADPEVINEPSFDCIVVAAPSAQKQNQPSCNAQFPIAAVQPQASKELALPPEKQQRRPSWVQEKMSQFKKALGKGEKPETKDSSVINLPQTDQPSGFCIRTNIDVSVEDAESPSNVVNRQGSIDSQMPCSAQTSQRSFLPMLSWRGKEQDDGKGGSPGGGNTPKSFLEAPNSRPAKNKTLGDFLSSKLGNIGNIFSSSHKDSKEPIEVYDAVSASQRAPADKDARPI